MKKTENYYLGLDIGTDSVGYAATTESYDLLKFRGEPVWGVTTFEAAKLAEERRINRTARRRLDRRQQRVKLLSDLFAPEICKIDPNFFIRRKESALFAEDTQHGVKLFDGGITDQEYHKKYPTIHHLIVDLMKAESPRDIRLVYLACAWLVANRGHFLLEGNGDQIRDFHEPYSEFVNFFCQDIQCNMPWAESITAETIRNIMQQETGVTQKTQMFTEKIFGGKKPAKKPDEDFPFSRDAIVKLLSGGTASPSELFCNDDYKELGKITLGMDEDNFANILAELGDDGALLRAMRAMYECALLNITLRGAGCISEAKVMEYEQHHRDLVFLKHIIKKYCAQNYAKVFRQVHEGNYVAYSGYVRQCPEPKNVKRVKKEVFCDFIKKIVKDIQPDEADREQFADMLMRLELYTFLPKQKNSDNRVIPHQLYEKELEEILGHAAAYLPMLNDTDKDGTTKDKILSIFSFRIPYYVGPLNEASKYAWLKRFPGKIYPWNFDKMVVLDESEQRFIKRMTNSCTYLPGESVLPYCSLLYSRFMVLNELNNLKVDQQSIPVSLKQELYTALFVDSPKKVTKKSIIGYLKSHGYTVAEVSGVDDVIKSNLKPYHSFRRMLENGVLTEEQVEEIINHAAYTEDRSRMNDWLWKKFPNLPEADRKYILTLKLKEFGRLSRHLLCGIMGCAVKGSGEAMSIMEALWQTNDNLMQLLSERYTFREQIQAFTQEYYSDPSHKKTLSQRLDDMYVSNAVKRQIIRSLDVCSDVVKAMGHAPERIFVEMARGTMDNQKGQRTLSRKQQILELYKKIKHEDVPKLLKELEAMGEEADNRLQDGRLFLYYMQLGKCMYTYEPIALSQLPTNACNIDHIYPQCKVQDDSILNNKVLCLSSENGTKGDTYPIRNDIRERMHSFWTMLKNAGLITEEKYRRLTRHWGFTEEELRQFINRQLVETRQTTKVVTQLLQERYPDAQIVYVKAGRVSEFRQEFKMLKCRSVNDLHHAKDAYLNIVVGNVYYEKFTRRWFDVKQEYTLNTKPLFERAVYSSGKKVWAGGDDLARVRKTMGKNAVHLTRYAFCRKGGLFDQMPLKAGEELVPRKKGLSTEKYGGYNKTAASFYMLASYTIAKKKDIMFVPVELMVAERVKADATYAAKYLAGEISKINGGKLVADVCVQLNGRPVKINAVLSLDGMPVTIRGKSSKGTQIGIGAALPLVIGAEWDTYVKTLERFIEKKKGNPNILLNEKYDHINQEDNLALYDLLESKMKRSIFSKCPGSILDTVTKGREKFIGLSLEDQVICLMGMVAWFGSQTKNVDLTQIGGKPKAGTKLIGAKLSAIAKNWKDVRIVDMSSSGLFVSKSENVLELL